MNDDGFIAGFMCGIFITVIITTMIFLCIDTGVTWVHKQEAKCIKNDGAKAFDRFHVTCNDGAKFETVRGGGDE